jgi:hypothetical protein
MLVLTFDQGLPQLGYTIMVSIRAKNTAVAG